MEQIKSEGELLSEKLSYSVKNVWEKSSNEEKDAAFLFCDKYKDFLDKGKTEREFVNEALNIAKQKGFESLEEILMSNKKLFSGMKIYSVNRNKSIILSVIGENPITEGLNIVGAHIDSPRIDVKQCPLYEDTGMAFLKTHYYGGIKKYQWVTIPLSLHGIIVKSDGSIININIGEDEKDPVFTITDLLPHLATDQMQKKLMDAIPGETLNLLLGSIPYNDDKVQGKVKLNILKLLNEKYGIIEEDFISAELEIVPAFKAKDVGLDRGLVGSYGQDDRVCAYTALMSILDIETPKKTSICVLTDKEEVGSMGNTGAQAAFFENFVSTLCLVMTDNYTDLITRNVLVKSKMLSADVSAAVDPNYDGVHDKKNATYLGKGIVLQKYTGVRGKAGASDANAEFIGQVRNLFNEKGIMWQTGELGKVDMGGGGTIALFMANMGMEVIDCGVAVLSMHSPFEISSKIDIYTTYLGYKVFLQEI